MAASSPPPRVESLSNPVQQLVINGEQVPENYIHRNTDDGPICASFPVTEIPIIDLGLLTSSSPTGEPELEKLRSALSSWGCFQAINHGMASSFLDKVREVTKEFFALPMEEKQKYSRTLEDIEGYGNDTVVTEHQTLDWTDRLYLLVRPEDQRKLKLWPENPETFRDTLNEYTEKLGQLTEIVLKAMAKSLSLDDSCFLDHCREGALMYTRFNLYPVCPRPDVILGLKPHADGSTITFLLQDKEVEGLQVLKDDQWVGVPIIPQALLINLGDQSELASNGIFKSPVHRVVTNSERERISLATFLLPHPDMEIEPANGLVNEQRPRLYKKVKNYVSLYFHNYQRGKRPIDTLKI